MSNSSGTGSNGSRMEVPQAKDAKIGRAHV